MSANFNLNSLNDFFDRYKYDVERDCFNLKNHLNENLLRPMIVKAFMDEKRKKIDINLAKVYLIKNVLFGNPSNYNYSNWPAAVDNKLDEKKPVTSFSSGGKEVLLIEMVQQILESSNKKSLYAGSILKEVKKIEGGDKITKQNVKDCLGYLISKDIAQIANPKISSLWGRKKAYKMTPEPKPSMTDKMIKNAFTPGSKTNKTAAYVGGNAISKKGLDVKINAGEDKKNQMSASLHVDKGLVSNGSSMSVAIEKAKKLLDDNKSTFST